MENTAAMSGACQRCGLVTLKRVIAGGLLVCALCSFVFGAYRGEKEAEIHPEDRSPRGLYVMQVSGFPDTLYATTA